MLWNDPATGVMRHADAGYDGCLMAGDICNTNVYEADDEATHATVRAMFEEQIAWAVDEMADFLIADSGATRRPSSHDDHQFEIHPRDAPLVLKGCQDALISTPTASKRRSVRRPALPKK